MTPSLLYIDDENENLKVFNRVFKKDFTIYTALSGEEGLDIFEKHPEVSLLVSDQRMPGMSGVDFLNACKHINPYPIRILITGYADLESTINAINEAEIYRFIKKPWEKLDLLQTLNEAQRRFELEKALRSLDELKNKFMMLVNHELKTPLTIQRSYLEFLKESSLDEEQSLYLEKSLSGSNRLETLISEILYFLKVQKEALLGSKETFELSEATGIQDLTGTPISTNKTYFCDAVKRLIKNAEDHKKKDSTVSIEQNDNILEIKNFVEKNPDINLILKPFEINEDAFNHTKGLGLGLSIATLILGKLGFPVNIICEDNSFKVSIDLSGNQTT
ncbi:MAG: hybrid sensor histidine kinase/response regulator [Bdellovibrionales bacterium]